MSKTKLDTNNQQHQILIATLANFVTDYGYTTRELFELVNDSQNKLWHALVDLEKETN